MKLLDDTTPEAWQVLLNGYRRMPLARRWQIMEDAYRTARAAYEKAGVEKNLLLNAGQKPEKVFRRIP